MAGLVCCPCFPSARSWRCHCRMVGSWGRERSRGICSASELDGSQRGNQKQLGGHLSSRPSDYNRLQKARSSAIVSRCVDDELGKTLEALDLMVQQGFYVDVSVFYNVLKRCVARKDLGLGGRVHALAVTRGYQSSAFFANHLIGMYAQHGMLKEAMLVFSNVTVPNAHVWSSIILAHARHGQPTEAIRLYQNLRRSSVKPDDHIFVAVLKACAGAADLASGREVHADILETAIRPNKFISSCLVDMYAKCGSLVHAREVFDDLLSKNVVTWTTMIAGYAEHGLGQEALTLYAAMQDQGIAANDVTFSCLLRACAGVGALHQGKQLHSQIQAQGLERDVVVGTCLLDMYVKCGSLEDARTVFDNLPKKNVVTWTAMIAGYAKYGSLDDARKLFDRLPTSNVITWNAMIAGYTENELAEEALILYARMQKEGIVLADSVTYVGVLKACASVGALYQGKQLHAQIQERGLEGDLVVGSCLVDMYAKCGSLKDAREVFDRLATKSVVTWNALLNGYANHSDGQMAVQFFKNMQRQGIVPNDVTFTCLLVACSHETLLKEGKRYFDMMVQDYGIAPTVRHYDCMVDLFGRSGLLDEAENMLQTMPFENVVGWTSLLSACKSHGDLERGKRCFDRLITLEPKHGSAYVVLASMYANVGKWRDVRAIEALRKSAGAKKRAAKAYIELRSKVHKFTVGEDSADISSKLRIMNSKLKEGGHVPQTELVLKVLPETEKEDALCGHAEKLALAYGLLNTPEGTTLLVTKNLRMCNDCHNSTKIMSSLEKRDIVVRDGHRVHHFVDGFCSCGDRH